MNKPKLIAVLVAAALVLIVLLQNTAAVETRFLFFSFTMPRAFLLLITALVGFAMGVIVAVSISKRNQ